MVWTNGRDRPRRYLISVGRDRLRSEILNSMWDICDVENSTMADEIWDALYMHVERHGGLTKNDGRVMLDRVEEVKDDAFDDAVVNESNEAQEQVVEEVLDAERRVERRMATSHMFGNKGNA